MQNYFEHKEPTNQEHLVNYAESELMRVGLKGSSLKTFLELTKQEIEKNLNNQSIAKKYNELNVSEFVSDLSIYLKFKNPVDAKNIVDGYSDLESDIPYKLIEDVVKIAENLGDLEERLKKLDLEYNAIDQIAEIFDASQKVPAKSKYINSDDPDSNTFFSIATANENNHQLPDSDN